MTETATVFDMRAFCGKSDLRYMVSRPFVFAGHQYATDCKAAVRVPCGGPDTPKDGPKFPPITNLSYWSEFPLSDGITPDLSGIPPEVFKTCEECDGWECPECDGTGEVEWTGDYSGHAYHADCRLCDGDGTIAEAVAKRHGCRRRDAGQEVCEACGGTKKVRKNEEVSRVIDGVKVCDGYLRLLAGLPGLRVKASTLRGDKLALLFEGDGGVQGLAMGLYDPYAGG